MDGEQELELIGRILVLEAAVREAGELLMADPWVPKPIRVEVERRCERLVRALASVR